MTGLNPIAARFLEEARVILGDEPEVSLDELAWVVDSKLAPEGAAWSSYSEHEAESTAWDLLEALRRIELIRRLCDVDDDEERERLIVESVEAEIDRLRLYVNQPRRRR